MFHPKKCETCGRLMSYHDDSCDPDDVRRHKANVRRRESARKNRAAMRDALDSVGVKRVLGSMGGTFYE